MPQKPLHDVEPTERFTLRITAGLWNRIVEDGYLYDEATMSQTVRRILESYFEKQDNR